MPRATENCVDCRDNFAHDCEPCDAEVARIDDPKSEDMEDRKQDLIEERKRREEGGD